MIVEWNETHTPTRMIGRIGYPGDRTVRYAPGPIDRVLHVDGFRFVGVEAEAIALILFTEIPA